MTFMFIAGYTWQGSRWKDAPCGPAVNTGWWLYVPPGHSWNLQLLVLPASAIPVFMEFASMTWTGKSVSRVAFHMLMVWPFYAVNLCVIQNEENRIFVMHLMVFWILSYSACHMVTIPHYIFQWTSQAFLTLNIGNTHFLLTSSSYAIILLYIHIWQTWKCGKWLLKQYKWMNPLNYFSPIIWLLTIYNFQTIN